MVPAADGPDRRVGKDIMPAVSPDPAGPARSSPHRSSADGQADNAEEHVHSPERQPAQPAPVLDQRTLAEAGELLRALAAPVRIAIVLQLREAERCVHELVETLHVTQPLISQHLRVLKSAGVVNSERHGREVVYRLVDEHLAHIVVDAATHAEELSGAPRGGTEAAQDPGERVDQQGSHRPDLDRQHADDQGADHRGADQDQQVLAGRGRQETETA